MDTSEPDCLRAAAVRRRALLFADVYKQQRISISKRCATITTEPIVRGVHSAGVADKIALRLTRFHDHFHAAYGHDRLSAVVQRTLEKITDREQQLTDAAEQISTQIEQLTARLAPSPTHKPAPDRTTSNLNNAPIRNRAKTYVPPSE